jgi:cytochrome oxidase Cu insertion factor (SCO1/SenC/PrrC family)
VNDIRLLKISISLCFALLISATVWTLLRKPAPPAIPLENYGPAPSFRLTSHLKRSFDSADLKGKVWVVSFVYTTCKDSCPMLGAQMKRLAQGMPDSQGFRMLSISVDPEKDTPERLARYANDLGVQDPRWFFLTGKKAEIKDLVAKGFRLASSRAADGSEVLHSSKLVLVDKQGIIRGYFDGLFGESAEIIRRAAGQLLAQP